MKSRYVRYLLLLVAFCLPVQAMAAFAMPLCRHVQHADAAVQAAAAGDEHANCHEGASPEAALQGDGCDNCEACHIAAGGFVPSAEHAPGLVAAENRYVLPAIAAPNSHIGEPPQQPPRRRA